MLDTQEALSTPSRRFRAWLDMHLVDHGCVRAIYNNFYALGGGMYRSSQPSPRQIRKYHARFGIRSIINLRGVHDYGSYFFEDETCTQLGIKLISVKLYSRTPPSVEEIHRIREIFASLEYPALIHCKSGADRAGLGAALYRILHLGHPVSEAVSELSWKYGHSKRAKTGVLDFFFATYLARNASSPIDFMDWVDHEYDEKALKQRFRDGGFASLIVDKVLHRE
ncbi:tyrosine-protein phosphatase [Azoarcus sp. L1K30]|uniref:tyrosine-protein phosphatase n=1 Tax=Azoarcus sp. L1K30 TaxID=2820277 RepID=UPI002011F045|nr:tyrosine-protein phosphatase [Azoarcus sp. L1K30]